MRSRRSSPSSARARGGTVELTYQDAVAHLEGALAFGVNPSLDGITALCEELGRPQDALRCVQVAGTNGKTSTVRLLDAILRAHGVRTGLYTSPHLERYPERIEVAGSVIDDATFASVIGDTLAAARRLRGIGAAGGGQTFTEFEILTAAALHAFRRARVEVAVLEVGLGGRWDATSVVRPEVAVVTGVSLDHTAILGDTVEEIAAEKAAIIRPGAQVVLGPGTRATRDVFSERADACGCRTVVVDEPASRTVAPGVTVPQRLPGYQAVNVAVALRAAEAVLGREPDPRSVSVALEGVRIPARFERVCDAPVVIADGSHNPEAAAVLAGAVREAWPGPDAGRALVIGVLADKDADGIVEALAEAAPVIAVAAPASPRACDAIALADIVEARTGRRPAVHGSVPEALVALRDGGHDPIIATGSLVTAAEARRWARQSCRSR